MTIEVKDRPERRRYELTEDGEVVGFLTFRRRGAPSTWSTPRSTRTTGDGAWPASGGGRPRRRPRPGLAVLPSCPYAARLVDGHADQYLDLVPADRRARYSDRGLRCRDADRPRIDLALTP